MESDTLNPVESSQDQLRQLKQEASQDDDDEDYDEDELPPILAPPSTGYLHTVNANQSPPRLLPEDGSENDENDLYPEGDADGQQPEIVDLKESDEDLSTTTDSDDDLVGVDYFKNPPPGFRKALKKYEFVNRKDMWVYNIRKFYHSQPARIRRLLKTHKDVDGNPIEEPIELLFEKIHEERERMRKAQNIKCERGEDPDKDVGPASVVKFNVTNQDAKLTHVLYPGNVVNDEKAIATLGGLGNISKVFDQPTKKLILKYRPNDPFANAATGQGHSTCGILLRVRRRKNPSAKPVIPEQGGKINLDSLGSEPPPVDLIHDVLLENQMCKSESSSSTSIKINHKTYKQQDLLSEDQILMEEKMRELKTGRAWIPGQSSADCNLKIPKILETVPDKNTMIEPVGIVRRSYDFSGICDFQYLPMTKKSDGTHVSIKDKIFPLFGAKDNPEELVVKGLSSAENECRLFGLPPTMSRIDNPPRGLIDDLIVSEKAPPKVVPPDESIFSSRTKRIIYTISYNFQVSSKEKQAKVPSQPLSMATADIERRQIKKDMVDLVRSKFEERPIWSKVALEYATKIPSQTLKYIIPIFSYFASNGPWRNTWIKFDLDPRDNPRTVVYQSVDFRIPFIYRRFMDSNFDNPPEIAHSFMPGYIPTKAQMFYQLCDIKLNEIKELIKTLKRKAEQPGGLTYDERYGFLKEGSFEYFRYIMTYYLENMLQERGKIIEVEVPQPTFAIPPGSIEPQEKLKADCYRRLKNKRMRKSTRRGDSRTVRSPKGKVTSSTRPSMKTVEDLELNRLSEGEDDSYEDEDDDELDD